MSDLEQTIAAAEDGPAPAEGPAFQPEPAGEPREAEMEPSAPAGHGHELREDTSAAGFDPTETPSGEDGHSAAREESAPPAGSPDAEGTRRPEQRLGEWLHEAPALASDLYGLLIRDELPEGVRRAAAASLTGLSYLLTMTPASVQSLAELEWVLCATQLVASEELPSEEPRWEALRERLAELDELASASLGVSGARLREHAQGYFRIDVRGRCADDLLAVAAARVELAKELEQLAEGARPTWVEDTYQLQTFGAYLRTRLNPTSA